TFPDNINLATITPQAVDQVLSDRSAVLQLVECFEHESKCVQRGALSFVRQVRRLGPGGRCVRCTSREQNHIRAVMRRTVAGMQRHHPAQWRRLVPYIRNI
ncbi:Insect odorant-binding protein A10/Ejaculatory bulb-specific protein 3, partial [Trinorchestia longiramus]